MSRGQQLAVILLSASLGIASGIWLGLQAKNGIEYIQTVNHADGLVYLYIVGKVEGNDDLLAQVLTDKAEKIIKPGQHKYPGNAEKMGSRYKIYRYSQHYENGALFYDVEFFRPSTGLVDQYNLLVIKTDAGWLIAKNSSIDEVLMEEAKKDEKPYIVHEYGER